MRGSSELINRIASTGSSILEKIRCTRFIGSLGSEHQMAAYNYLCLLPSTTADILAERLAGSFNLCP